MTAGATEADIVKAGLPQTFVPVGAPVMVTLCTALYSREILWTVPALVVLASVIPRSAEVTEVSAGSAIQILPFPFKV